MKAIRDAVDRDLRAIPIVARALAGSISKDDYARYIGSIARVYAPHSPRVMGLAASRCPASHHQIAEYYLAHAVEESGHDRWAADDFSALRSAAQLAPQPVEACLAMVGYTYFLAGTANPVALLGWMYILESVGADLGPDAVLGLRKTGVPLRFVQGHAEADVGHTAEMEGVISRLVTERTDQHDVLQAARVSAYLYVDMFRQLERDANGRPQAV